MPPTFFHISGGLSNQEFRFSFSPDRSKEPICFASHLMVRSQKARPVSRPNIHWTFCSRQDSNLRKSERIHEYYSLNADLWVSRFSILQTISWKILVFIEGRPEFSPYAHKDVLARFFCWTEFCFSRWDLDISACDALLGCIRKTFIMSTGESRRARLDFRLLVRCQRRSQIKKITKFIGRNWKIDLESRQRSLTESVETESRRESFGPLRQENVRLKRRSFVG